jgi:hypothetical protein
MGHAVVLYSNRVNHRLCTRHNFVFVHSSRPDAAHSVGWHWRRTGTIAQGVHLASDRAGPNWTQVKLMLSPYGRGRRQATKPMIGASAEIGFVAAESVPLVIQLFASRWPPLSPFLKPGAPKSWIVISKSAHGTPPFTLHRCAASRDRGRHPGPAGSPPRMHRR